MSKKHSPNRSITKNRKAYFDFEILDKLECGIELKGHEVKSLRSKLAILDQAYARITEDEMWLIGCHIGPYEHAADIKTDPTRPRKLLAHKRQIQKWHPHVKTKGLTLVPLDMYFNERGLAKILIALVRGKTHGDKRQDLKKKQQQREMDRAKQRH